MTDTALEAAVTRLERAIGRLERAAHAPAAAPSDALVRLQSRHARLRERVQETVERLDALIGAPADAP